MNNVLIVGRLTSTPTLNYTETNTKYTDITLAITRAYKNTETNCYDTDFIPIRIYHEMANSVIEYTRKGDLIGIKGRLETYTTTDDTQTQTQTQTTKQVIVIADRVTFLSANTQNTNNIGEGEI